MTKLHKIFRSGEKGFTLIELLVVISILGALAAVVVLNVGQFMGRGCEQAAATELHNVQTAAIATLVEAKPLQTSIVAGALGATPGIGDYLIGPVHGAYTINASTGQVGQTAYAPCK